MVAGALFEFVEAVVGDFFGMGLGGLEVVDLEAEEVDGVFELLSDEFGFWVGGHLILEKDCHAAHGPANCTAPQENMRGASHHFVMLREMLRSAPRMLAMLREMPRRSRLAMTIGLGIVD